MRKNHNTIFLGIFLVYIFVALFYYLGNEGLIPFWTTEVAYLFMPSLVVIFGFLTVKRFSLQSGHGRNLGLLALGLASWAIAEFIWFGLEYIAGQKPFPSFADIFFIAGYPLIAWAILSELYQRKIVLTLGRILLLVAIIVNLGVLLAVTIFQNSQAYDSAAAKFFSLGYGVGDFLMLFVLLFVLFLAQEYEGGRLFRPWVLIFFGMVLFFGADLLFAFYGNLYEDKGTLFILIDLPWTLAYSMFGAGFADFWLITKEMAEKVKLSAQRNNA